MTKKLVLITGASGGIGRETAKLLAKNNYFVVIHYHKNQQKAQAILKEIEAFNGHGLVVQADCSKEIEVKQLYETIDQINGRFYGLVNNVGTLDKKSRLDQMGEKRLNFIFQTNIISYFLCAKYAILRLSKKYGHTGGVIVNVSSRASVIGSANEYIDYAASKGAIDSLTVGLANEVANEGIRVNCVRPGFIETDIHLKSGDPNRLEKIKANIPLKRAGKAYEVAESILWLISDKSSYTTGSFIDVAGGR